MRARGGLLLVAALLLAGPALAVERNLAGSAQLDYHLVTNPKLAGGARTGFDGFTSELALKLAVDVSDRVSANVKLCHGCHGFELPMAYFDFRLADELNVRVGRFSPSFGAFNLRHDPANHATSDKPLPYDMGRMLRREAWNLGVLPSPFPDNGLEIDGTHWFGESLALDYAAYAVSGFKAGQGSLDLDWAQSLSSNFYVVDNNGRPSVGGRASVTVRLEGGSDLTAGASVMHGSYDPENQFAYTIAGVDLAARLGGTYLRAEWLTRRQSFAGVPSQIFKQAVDPGALQVFEKDGFYLELERPLDEVVTVLGRVDGLYRVGNVAMTSTLEPHSAITRYTAAVTLGLLRGFRIKTSAELWTFGPRLGSSAEVETSFHLAVVGTL
jgi:hypothetical protein